jgi:hypothetical protein
MTALAPHRLQPASPLLRRLAELVQGRRLEAVVHTNAGDGHGTARLAALGLEVLAVDVRPECLQAARAHCRELGAGNVRFAQGHPPRVLADRRAQTPARTLWFFDNILDRGALPPPTVRDEIFWVPRGEGVIAVRLCGSVSGYADVLDQLLRWSPDHCIELCADDDGSMVLVAQPRPNVHVTFLIEKYTHEYGTSGISINLDNLVATLDQTGLATWNVVHYDECFHRGEPIPLAAISKPVGVDAHVLVTTCHYHSRANPSPALLQQARQGGSKVAFMWLDKKISQSTPDYYRVADVNVVLDGNDFDLPNAWPIFTPKNPIHFNDPGLERDIDVSLVGEVRYLSQRKAVVAQLEQERRIAVQFFKTSAADTDRALSIAEYAALYKRSKISLAMTKDAVRQLKGRVFEILHCGAMLLCDRNHHVSSYFTQGSEYVTWDDGEDLVQKCIHYLAHDDERRAIAAAGHRKVVGFYNHEIFWRSLLARLSATAATNR